MELWRSHDDIAVITPLCEQRLYEVESDPQWLLHTFLRDVGNSGDF